MKRYTAILTIFLICYSTAYAQNSGKKVMTMYESLLLQNLRSFRWSPDNTKIAYTKTVRDPENFASETHIYIHDVLSGESFQLTNSHKNETNPQWLPDGRVVFSSDRDGKRKLYVISTKGGEATPLFDDPDAPVNGTWSPDFSKLAYTKRDERADKKEWDKKKKDKDDGYYWEEDDRFTRIYVYDIETKEHKKLTQGDFNNSSPRWSPDGNWIAFTSNRTAKTEDNNNTDIWIVSSDSGAERQLTTNPGPDSSPVWSSDGESIAYVAQQYEKLGVRGLQSDLMVIDSQGGKPLNLTTDYDYSISSPIWSKDDRSVYFTGSEAPSRFLYKIPSSDGEIEKVLPDNEYVYSSFTMSNDGKKWLFSRSSVNTTGEVFTANVNGQSIKTIMDPNNGMRDFHIAKSEVIRWKGADNWEIHGILTYPLHYEKGKKYPLILQIHGGPYGQYRKTFTSSSQIWASRGYAVLRPNPRGSAGHSLKFMEANVENWGGKDKTDLMKGVDHVIKMGLADEDRLAVMGGSYGGFMTFWLVTQTDRFKAAIGHAAIADWFAFYGQTDIPNLLQFGFGGYPWEMKKVFEKFSPIEFVQNVKTPLLITHGENDIRVPITQGEQFFRSLKKLNKNVRFLRFPREGHGIREPRHRIHLDKEQEKWFQQYIFPEKYEQELKGVNKGKNSGK